MSLNNKFFLYKHFTLTLLPSAAKERDSGFSLSLFTFSAQPHAITASASEESIWQPCNEYRELT